MESRKIRTGFFTKVSHALGLVGAPVYNLVFGRSDKQLSDENTRRLAEEIEISFSRLLAMYRGKVPPAELNAEPNGFDYGIVIVQFDNLRLQIIRGRGELDVNLASAFVSDNRPWWSLRSVWLVVASKDWEHHPSIYDSLDVYAKFLETYWTPLVCAFSLQEYPVTRDKLLRLCNYPFGSQTALTKMSLEEQLACVSKFLEEGKQ
ncbi:MAG: hypothetical protein ABSF28_27205 [Terracidiphilus sp.]|jgi:hypothetical protein